MHDPNFQQRVLPQHATTEGDRYRSNVYTSAFFDLIDSENQNASSTDRPIDNVSGFTILQIQEIVRECASWDDIIKKIKNVYPAEAIDPITNRKFRDLIQELFDNWN